jgi:hypothetical protein
MRIERLELARLEVIAAGKNNAVVVRQQDARVGDGIDAAHFPSLLIEDEMAKLLLAIRAHLEQDEIADRGVINLRVVECLVLLLDGLQIDPLSRLGVVLDLDREVAADAFDKDAILNRDVWIKASAMQFAMRALPLEFVLRRISVLVIESIPDITKGPAIAKPLEGLDVRHAFSHAKLHKEMRPDERKLREDGVLVVLVERLEVGLKLRIGEGIDGQSVKLALLVFVQGKDIVEVRLGPQSELHVITEEKAPPTNRDEIARQAIVLRGDTIRGDEPGLDRAEDFLPGDVQLLQPRTEIVAVRAQARTENLVGTLFEHLGRSCGHGIRHGAAWPGASSTDQAFALRAAALMLESFSPSIPRRFAWPDRLARRPLVFESSARPTICVRAALIVRFLTSSLVRPKRST